MKAAVIATIILVVLFGGAAYLAVAGTLICFGAQYIQSSRLSKSKTESNFKKERIRQWETV